MFGMEIGEWLTLIVAVAAVVLATAQAFWQRRHDRLSVTPHLVMHFEDHIKDEREASIKIEIENIGTGPALFESFNITDSGVETNFERLGKEKIRPRRELGCFGYQMLAADGLAAGKNMDVASYEFEVNSTLDLCEFIRSLYQLDVKIHYKSIHNIRQEPLHHTGEVLRERNEQVIRQLET